MYSLGNSRIIFPSFDELIFTNNPKFSASMSMLSTVPPLMYISHQMFHYSPASTGKSFVILIISDSGV